MRWKNSDGTHEIVQPGEPSYSLALFLAQEFYIAGQWEPANLENVTQF